MGQTLCLGEIGNAGASPAAGAQVYYLSRDSYGNQVTSTGGSDGPLTVESEDLFPADDAGLVKLRRVYVRAAVQFGNCNVRVSVIADDKLVTTKGFSLPTPKAGREIHDLEIPVVARCSKVRIRVVRVTNTARLELLKWYAGVRPAKNVTPTVGILEP